MSLPETSEIKALLDDLEGLIRKDDQLIDDEEIDEAAIQANLKHKRKRPGFIDLSILSKAAENKNTVVNCV